MGRPVYLKVEKKINHPLEKVWEAVALGFGNVADYNPAIKASKLEGESDTGIGMKRHCDFQPKGYIKEEIISWKEKESYKLKFTESSMPMSFLESKFSFKEINGSTHVTQEFWYRMKAPMGWLSSLMKGKMRSTLEGGLEGLDNFLKH